MRDPPSGGGVTDPPSGRGVRIAVIDSGVHPGHPHLGPIAEGIAFTSEGEPHDDLVDRLGHGTAVTAAIQERAPAAEVCPVKVFDDRLATSVPTLILAIDWASERGCRLVNLSLGTPHAFRADELQPAIDRAAARGSLVVSPRAHDGRRWLPGSLPGAVGVELDWEVPRESVRVEERAGRAVVLASGYPRPIPGVPPERNLKGVSFAAANATGVLALALEGRDEVRDAEGALEALIRYSSAD